MEEEDKQERALILDGQWGVYVPQRFATRHDPAEWGVSPEDLAVLLAGPEHEDYCDVWDDVLRTARHTDSAGRVWTLSQDGDLFAVAQD